MKESIQGSTNLEMEIPSQGCSAALIVNHVVAILWLVEKFSALLRLAQGSSWETNRNNPLGLRPFKSGVERVRFPLCLWGQYLGKAMGRPLLDLGWGCKIPKDYMLWAHNWSRGPPNVPVHLYLWVCGRSKKKQYTVLWSQEENHLSLAVSLQHPLSAKFHVLAVKEKCFENSVHHRAGTEGWFWS